MQLTTELHVSTLQGHHQAYKIMVLTKAHAVILPTGSRGLQFTICKPSDPVGSITACPLVTSIIL